MQHASQALVLAAKHGERGHEAYALYHLAESAAALDPPETAKAETSYCEAIVLAEELGMRPLRAKCKVALAALYGRSGRQEAGAALMSTATREAQDMDMFLPSKADAGGSGSARVRPSL